MNMVKGENMARENLIEFEKLLREDAALRQRLEGAVKSFAGDRTDERAVFEATIVPIADELGLSVTYDDANALSADRGISEEELEAVAGGWSGCFVIGLSNEGVAECGEVTGEACYYVGVGGILFT